MRIVIEVEGGCVQAVYAPMVEAESLDVILVDWDNIKAGEEPGRVVVNTLESAPASTLDIIGGLS